MHVDAENTTEQPLMGTGKVWGGHAVFRTQKSISYSYCPYPPCHPLSLAFSNPCECLSFPNQNFSLEQHREKSPIFTPHRYAGNLKGGKSANAFLKDEIPERHAFHWTHDAHSSPTNCAREKAEFAIHQPGHSLTQK